MNNHFPIRQLAVAIYTINRHAKTAIDNKELYMLKKMAIDKLLKNGHAEKIGLHFIENPKFSKQHSTLLIRCGEFLFHTIPEKEDFISLPHLGQQDSTSRNPQDRMSLKVAKELLFEYVGAMSPSNPQSNQPNKNTKKKRISNNQGFRSTYLDG